MTACGDVWLVQADCPSEDAPLNVDSKDPEEYRQQPPEGMYMSGVHPFRLCKTHQDLGGAAAANPSTLHP